MRNRNITSQKSLVTLNNVARMRGGGVDERPGHGPKDHQQLFALPMANDAR